MSEEKSHTEIIAELRTQLTAVNTNNNEERARLDMLLTTLDTDDHEPETLVEHLNENLYLFGADHPDLVAAIHRALAILGTGGI